MTLIEESENNSIGRKVRYYVAPLLFMTGDYVMLMLAGQLSICLYDLSIAKTYIYLWLPITFIIFLAQNKAYTAMYPFIYIIRSIFYAISYGLFACLVAIFFFTHWQAPRSFFAVFWLLAMVLLCLERTSISLWLKKGHHLYEKIILIGAGRTAERTLHFFKNDLGYRYQIIGLIDDNPLSAKLANKYIIFGKVEKTEQIVREHSCQTVIITAPGMEISKLQQLINTVQPLVRNLSYVPDLIGMPMPGIEAQSLFSEEILMLKMKNNLAVKRNRIYKRIFDFILTIVGGIIISPVMLVLALYIKIDSEGNVFYNAERIGKNGKTFRCYKFRSMYVNSDEILQKYLNENQAAAQEWKKYAKLRGYDPRVTKAGAWLRKYSLDELPQIINVLKGDMSLVGPRPYLPREKKDIGKAVDVITLTLPGITGYWQVSGRNDVSFKERVAMDTWYIRNWSLWLDIMYLAKTLQAVMFSKGAY